MTTSPDVTPADISAMYDVLEGLSVHLDHVPEFGLVYLRHQLIVCREKQDITAEMGIRVNRALGAQRAKVRVLAAARKVATTPDLPAAMEAHELAAATVEALKFLLNAITLRRQHLTRTSTDIRTLSETITVGDGSNGQGRRNTTRRRSVRTDEDEPAAVDATEYDAVGQRLSTPVAEAPAPMPKVPPLTPPPPVAVLSEEQALAAVEADDEADLDIEDILGKLS